MTAFYKEVLQALTMLVLGIVGDHLLVRLHWFSVTEKVCHWP